MKRIVLITLAIVIGLLSHTELQADDLHIRVLDVGEGQAVLLHKNQRAILIDTGHAGVARNVLDRLEQLKIGSLDYLVLTHLHPDHASGLFRIHEAYPEAGVLDNCSPVHTSMTPDMIRWTDQFLRQIKNRQCLVAGDRVDWTGVDISVLWPIAQPKEAADLNGNSLVLKIVYNKRSMLLMGDAGYEAEKVLLTDEKLKPVDLLIVGHHGADDASSEVFLQVVQPEKAVISINKDNFRGYPSSKVLKRLDALGIEVYKTYEDGELHLVF